MSTVQRVSRANEKRLSRNHTRVLVSNASHALPRRYSQWLSLHDRRFRFLHHAPSSTIVLALSLSLSACTRSTDFPVDQTETLVTQGLDARCGLATIVSREELPAVDGLKRVAVHYEANCVPDGGDIPHRVKAVMTFSQSHGSFGARPWTKAGNHYEPDPPVAFGRCTCVARGGGSFRSERLVRRARMQRGADARGGRGIALSRQGVTGKRAADEGLDGTRARGISRARRRITAPRHSNT